MVAEGGAPVGEQRGRVRSFDMARVSMTRANSARAAPAARWRNRAHRCPNAQLRLIGDVQPGGTTVDGVELPAGVGWAPAVVDVRPWLAAADVVAVPSRWEGLALVVVEALATTGRPVVASDVPGIRELVTDGCSALVPADDPGALADAIALRLGRPALRAAEGAAAARSDLVPDSRRTWDQLAELTGALAPVRGPAPVEPV